MSQRRADATLELITEAGINHIDTAAMYGDRRSASRLPASHRDDVFLATKTRGRTAAMPRRTRALARTHGGRHH